VHDLRTPPSADDYIDFIEGELVLTEDRWAGQPFRLKAWQRRWIAELFKRDDDGLRHYTHGLLGLPRGNGKSTMISALELAVLVLEDVRGIEVYSLAGDKDQARVVFNTAKKMYEASVEAYPDGVLADQLVLYRDRIEYPERDGVLRVLPADASREQGLRPYAAFVDEVHVLEGQAGEDLWNAMESAMQKREEPLLVGITTAGVGEDSLLYRLCDDAEKDPQPRFFYTWFGLPPDHEMSTSEFRSMEAARLANPALQPEEGDGDPFIFERVLETIATKMPENQYRRFHLNQWTSSTEAFITPEMWRKNAGMPDFSKRDRVVLSVDVGLKHDSTVVTTLKREDAVNVFHATFKFWIPTPGNEVPLTEVIQYIRDECAEYKVDAILYDKFFFAYPAEILANEHFPMVEFPQSGQYMCPGTQSLYEAFAQQRIRTGDDKTARKQILAAVTYQTERGVRLTKAKSRDRIDAAVSLAMGVEYWNRVPIKKRQSAYMDKRSAPPGYTSSEWRELHPEFWEDDDNENGTSA